MYASIHAWIYHTYVCLIFVFTDIHRHMYVHAYIPTYMYTYILTYIHMSTCTHVWNMCMFIQTYMYACIQTHVCLSLYIPKCIHWYCIFPYTYMHACIHTYIYKHTDVCNMCIYAPAYTHIYPHMAAYRHVYEYYIYIYIYIYILSSLLLSGFLFHSCWRNPSLLIVQQHQSLATWLQFGPIVSSWSSHQCVYGWPLGCLWSHGHHSVTCLVQLLSFSCETCPAHWCLLVQIWWITSMTSVWEDPACTFSVTQC